MYAALASVLEQLPPAEGFADVRAAQGLVQWAERRLQGEAEAAAAAEGAAGVGGPGTRQSGGSSCVPEAAATAASTELRQAVQRYRDEQRLLAEALLRLAVAWGGRQRAA